MRKNNIILIGSILAVITILCCAYSYTSFCEQPITTADSKIPCDNIFILEPFIVYEDAYNEQNLHAVDINVKSMIDSETSIFAMDVLSKSGFKPLGIGAITSEQKTAIENTYNVLQNKSEELVRQWKDKGSFLKDFEIINNTCKADALLVQFVKVKVGSPGGWDFMFTGNVIPDSSTTSIKAAILDLKTGKTYWSNSSIERTIPNNNSVVKRLLNTLYSKFPGYTKKEAGK